MYFNYIKLFSFEMKLICFLITECILKVFKSFLFLIESKKTYISHLRFKTRNILIRN
jgi:hypothetical protein